MVKKLFITPQADAVGDFTRCVRVPANQSWLAVFNAALLLVANADNYEQIDDLALTPDQAAAQGYQVYVDWLSGVCSLDCDDVLGCLAPYTAGELRAGTYNVNTVDPTDATVIETRFPSAARGTAILPPPALCDPDELWAGILEIVTRIDNNGRDFWQTVVSEVDKIDRIAEIIALVPLFGDIVGEGLSILADIAPTMLNAYDSYSTQAQIEEIACDLFQTVCSECRFPTYQEVFDYYSGRSALGTTQWQNIAFDAIVDVLLGTSGASEGIIYMTTNIVQIWVLSAAATWIQTHGVRFVALWAGVGAAVPSDAWELLCGACGGAWTHTWLGGDGQGPWTPYPSPYNNNCECSYNATEDRFDGCRYQLTNTSYDALVSVAFTSPVTITDVEMEYAYKVTRNTGADHARIEANIGQTLNNYEFTGTPTGTGTLVWAGNKEVDNILLTVITGALENNTTGYSRITKITVSGSGPDPFA